MIKRQKTSKKSPSSAQDQSPFSFSAEHVTIITGAARGIGLAIAERMLQERGKVVIVDRDQEAGKKALTALDAGERVLFVAADVSKESDVKKIMQRTLKTYGRIDGLVNNAALANPETAPIESLSLSEWNNYISVNLTSVFLCCKYASPHLKKSLGTIINMASTRAHMAEPHTEPYSACKGAVVALTQALSISLGPQIRVNTVSPGWIHVKPRELLKTKDHAQHPVGRVGEGRDIAGIVRFLLSKEAGFVTGSEFVVDGGMSHKMIYE